jgi:hypothetical protein
MAASEKPVSLILAFKLRTIRMKFKDVCWDRGMSRFEDTHNFSLILFKASAYNPRFQENDEL